MTDAPEQDWPTPTLDAYRRWLRAQRPPFDWFLRLTELEQEAIANEGEQHHLLLIEETAARLAPADAAGAGLTGAAAAVQSMLDGFKNARQERTGRLSATTEPAPPITPSMAGFGERREQAIEDAQKKRDAGRSLGGREPDSLRGGDT